VNPIYEPRHGSKQINIKQSAKTTDHSSATRSTYTKYINYHKTLSRIAFTDVAQLAQNLVSCLHAPHTT